MNPALCELLGRDEADLRACTWQELTHPDDVDADLQLVEEVLTGQREGYRMLKRYLRPDGSAVWGDLAVGCVRDEGGEVEYFISQIVDVTQQHTLQERFRLLAENASDVVFSSNDQMQLEWVSPSAGTLLGWGEEVIGQRVVDGLMHPDDIPAIQAAAQATEQGEPITYRARFRCGDGRWKWLAITVRPVFDAEGHLVGRIGSGRDVDAEQQAQQELAEQHAYLRTVIDSELDPRVLVAAVRNSSGAIVDLEYLDVNPRAVAFIGRAEEEIVGSRMLDLFRSQGDVRLFAQYVHALETGEPVVIDEMEMASEQGGTAWLDVRAVPIGSALSITWRDVSERHHAWAALEASEAQKALILDNASDMITIGSNEGVITWVSPSITDRLGWAPEEVSGRPFALLVHEEDRPGVRDVQANLLAGQQQHFTVRLQSKSGEFRWFDILVKPVFDDAGQVIGRVAGSRDVHDEHTAQRQLAESQAEYRTIAENAGDVVIRLDADMLVAWASPSAQDFSGFAPEDVMGRPPWAMVHPDDVHALQSALADLQVGRTADLHAQARLQRKDGTYQHWSITARQPQSSGSPSGLVVSLRNIDEQVRARRVADAEARRREAMLNSMLDPHVLMKAIRNASGEIVDFMYIDANDAACTYNSIERDDLLGKTVMELLPGHAGSDLFARYVHTVETGEPLILDDYVYPHDIIAEARHYDIRGIKVGDAMSFTWRDITDRALIAHELAVSEERFRLIATNTSDLIAMGNAEGVLRWVSPSLTKTLGWQPADWIGHKMVAFIHPDDVTKASEAHAGVMHGESPILRARVRDVQGMYHWAESRGAPLMDAHGTVQGATAVITIIDDRVAWEEALRHRASHDPLTGLLTRDEAYRRLAAMLSHAPRTGVRTFLAFLDLDNMKSVNDTFGHTVGDELLRVTAQRIQTMLRDGDQIARIGGDEMLIILSGMQGTDAALTLMNQLLDATGKPHTFEGHTLYPRMSIGLAEITPGDDIEQAVHRADTAMYEAKTGGGQQVKVRLADS
jgi:diguanylate cyclase (GGDEF)-like protein/PAS domain S-box-containing protein